MGSALSQLGHAITGEEETKQSKDETFSEQRDLSARYFHQLLQSVRPGEVRRSLVQIWPLSKKISESNELGGLEALALGDDGALYAIGGDGRMALIFATGIRTPVAGAVSLRSHSLALSDMGRVRVFDLISGKQTHEQTKIRTRVNSLDFDAAGETLLLGGTDARVYRWKFLHRAENVKEAEQSLERYIGHATVVNRVRYHPRGRIFFSADWSGRVSAWMRYDADAFGGEYLKNATQGRPFTVENLRANAQFGADGTVEGLECDGAGELLVVASDKGELSLLMVRGFKPLAKTQAHRGLIYDLAFSDDGRSIVTVGRDDHLRLWNIESLDLQSIDPTKAEIVLDSELETPGANRLALTSGGKIILGFKNGEIRILSRDQLMPKVVAEPDSGVKSKP